MKGRNHWLTVSKRYNGLKGGAGMSLLVLKSKSQNSKSCKTNDKDWPAHIPKPSNDDIAFLAEMSKRETSSSFFEKNKRSDRDGKASVRNRS